MTPYDVPRITELPCRHSLVGGSLQCRLEVPSTSCEPVLYRGARSLTTIVRAQAHNPSRQLSWAGQPVWSTDESTQLKRVVSARVGRFAAAPYGGKGRSQSSIGGSGPVLTRYSK